MIRFQDPQVPGEEEAIQAIVQATIEKQRKSHKAGTLARRDVHSKSLGLVNVRLDISERLPQSLKLGLFSTPASYNGVIRFSNGAFGPDAYDILPNIRGLALKLKGVPGKKLMPGEESSDELDLLLANDQGFFIPSIEDYVLLSTGKMKELALKNPRVVLLLASAMKVIKNPLTTAYYSQLPYQFGDYACKFALIPDQSSSFFSLPSAFDAHFLRHAVENVLRQREAKFRLCVQFQKEGESIADSSRVWKGRFLNLGELTVLRHPGEIPESAGEGLSFNPWRTIAEHRPLSWAGRARLAVYRADFQWRSKENSNS